jgi:hypothetical protein
MGALITGLWFESTSLLNEIAKYGSRTFERAISLEFEL